MIPAKHLPRPARRHLIGVSLFGILALALFSACSVQAAAETKTVSGINAIRQEKGLPPLTPDPAIAEIARLRSADMAARGYFSHNPPDGCNFLCLLDTYDVPNAYSGENIAWNGWSWAETADVAVDMWRKSPPHLQNILNCHFERVGAGAAQAPDGKVYFTMIFEGNAAC